MAQLSIIIPVYRVEQTLDRCVRSVLCCERRDIEVLLVDDGSPDSCGTLCDQWATRDARVRVLHKRNGGLSDARNAGIEASHGDLLMFVDSDDELAPGTIEAAMKTMEEDEACDIAEFGVLRVSRSSDDKEERTCSKPVDGSCSNKPLFLEGELVFDPQTVSETHYVDMRLYWLRTRAYTHSYACNKSTVDGCFRMCVTLWAVCLRTCSRCHNCCFVPNGCASCLMAATSTTSTPRA